MSYSSINLAMISLFPSLIDRDFLGLPIFLFLPVLSPYYTTFLRYLQKNLHRLDLAKTADRVTDTADFHHCDNPKAFGIFLNYFVKAPQSAQKRHDLSIVALL